MMRQTIQAIALALVLAVPVAGCSTLSGWIGQTPPTQSQEEIIKTAQQVLITAHTVHKAAGETLIALANARVIRGQTAEVAKRYYNEASEWLKKADEAWDIGNAILTKQYADAAIRAVALATTQKGE